MDTMNKYATVAMDVICREIDSTSVLLNLENGRYYSLNNTGTYAYSLFDGKQDLKNVAVQIAEEFGVEESEAGKDLEELVVELQKEGLVELYDRPL